MLIEDDILGFDVAIDDVSGVQILQGQQGLADIEANLVFRHEGVFF